MTGRSNWSSEEKAFRRNQFPQDFNDHELLLLENQLYVTDDSRLHIRLHIYCSLCRTEYIIRDRLPERYTDFNYRAALAKFIMLGYFQKHECN